MGVLGEKGRSGMRLTRTTVGALVVSAALVVGGGAAVAAAAGPERGVPCEARLQARIDTAERSGRVSSERADRLRERVENLCGMHSRARIAAFGMLRAAAEFLGLDRAELRAQLPGTSLASLAERQGKSVSALRAAMIARANARLEKAVASGSITQARADRALERLEKLADRLAIKVFPST
jgi:hypothetical protein